MILKEKLNYNNKEASQCLGVSIKTLYNLRKAGLINSYKIGNRNYFAKSEIERFINSRNYRWN